MNKRPLFELGQCVATMGAVEILDGAELQEITIKHVTGDFGTLPEADKVANFNAIEHGDRILSAYYIKGNKFYVITEWDRSLTTVMLASDY
jgi:hypothetical protein